ncbi:N-acylglucosamine-6-phosphate 2-epimerase/N-acetylmannosamine-6-phosphate 2-epimerase / N-acetylmannosamine kinase [Faunimonas pinastri]|uniref:N-acylglucosamine-6-phosphate 2-epimerase n=1 Tax=Faunimonas pinastri TaxID=1855383 RepID=A0A1H9FAF4_9HYPH|nr:N-acylglucosamine-6-phosphate 2-epimerase/N-acetylmannosamine-6-phosphate 2-epimerase / N-acetylmannosamine kinase [Faunimonas pinastri]
MDRADIVVAFALAAEAAGASGLRIQGVSYVAAVRAATKLPIIGLVKRDEPDTPVFITPRVRDVAELAEAGADIVAFDATLRVRPDSVADLAAAAHRAGALAMADCSVVSDAEAALAAGVDVVGTTMSGYTDGTVPEGPDLDLLRDCVALGAPVFAEGRYNSPELAATAVRLGATAVVVGSAITRPEHITSWFLDAVRAARPAPARKAAL